MKKYILVILASALLHGIVHAQDKHKLSLSSGYFTDLFFNGKSPGFILKGNFGFKLKNNIWTNFYIAQAEVREDFTDHDLFKENGRINETYRLFGINFSRAYSIKKKHIISPATGIIYRQWFYAPPIYGIELDSELNQYYYGFRIDGETSHDIGLAIDLNYHYQINTHLRIGFTTGTYYLFQLGIEGLTFAPCIEIRF